MAFQTVNYWQVERRFLPSTDIALLGPFASHQTAKNRLQNIASGACALGLQGAFFYLLVTGLHGQFVEPLGTADVDAKSVTMIPINQNFAAKELLTNKPNTSASSPRQTQMPEIELSSTTELPAEWALAKVSVPRDIVVSEYPEPGSSSSTGGETYDPFAGAAPNRKTLPVGNRQAKKVSSTLAGRISGFFGSETEQMRVNAFEQWVEELRTRLPKAKGSVELTVSLGPDGTVKSGTVIGGSASPQVKFFVRNAVVGKDFSILANDRKETIIRLPSIKLG